MKKIFCILGGVILAILLLPAFVHPPVRDNSKQELVVSESARLIEALNEYRTAYGEFPEGEHAEIIAALRGENERKEVFLDTPEELLTEQGELPDPWGKPFKITYDHATQTPRIHSAGPDGFFQTAQFIVSDDYQSWHRPHKKH